MKVAQEHSVSFAQNPIALKKETELPKNRCCSSRFALALAIRSAGWRGAVLGDAPVALTFFLAALQPALPAPALPCDGPLSQLSDEEPRGLRRRRNADAGAEAQTYLIVALDGHTFIIKPVVALLPHRSGA